MLRLRRFAEQVASLHQAIQVQVQFQGQVQEILQVFQLVQRFWLGVSEKLCQLELQQTQFSIGLVTLKLQFIESLK